MFYIILTTGSFVTAHYFRKHFTTRALCVNNLFYDLF